MAKVIAYMANGLEEVECLAVVDVLRRAGIEVVMTSIHEQCEVEGSHGIRIRTDVCADQVNGAEADMIFLPGGMPGTANLKRIVHCCRCFETGCKGWKKNCSNLRGTQCTG